MAQHQRCAIHKGQDRTVIRAERLQDRADAADIDERVGPITVGIQVHTRRLLCGLNAIRDVARLQIVGRHNRNRTHEVVQRLGAFGAAQHNGAQKDIIRADGVLRLLLRHTWKGLRRQKGSRHGRTGQQICDMRPRQSQRMDTKGSHEKVLRYIKNWTAGSNRPAQHF